MPTTVLTIERPAVDAFLDVGERAYPHEACGLLLGTFDRDNRVRRAVEARAVTNINEERAHDRYEMDPAEYIRVEQDADARGLDIVGTYHTHPDHPSRPSETDRQRAADVWQNGLSWSYVIIQVQKGRVASWRSWALSDQRFFEENTCLPPFASPPR